MGLMIVVDGHQCQSIRAVHHEFARQAELPFYGSNLDALRDALTGMVERPLTIRWMNADESFKRFPLDMTAFEQVISGVEEEEQKRHSPLAELFYERLGGSS